MALAKNRTTLKHVVIKQIPLQEENEAYMNEIKILRAMAPHPYVITYFDEFYENNQANLVMEFARQGTLFQYCQRKFEQEKIQQSSPQVIAKYQNTILKLFAEVALALQHIHRYGIQHRDLSPFNIMLSDGHVKIIDFGYSTIKRYANSQKGTFQFIAPEIMQGNEYNAKCDVYSLGCSLYYCLFWREPYCGRYNATQILNTMKQQQEHRVPMPYEVRKGTVPQIFIEILDKTMELDPERRVTSTQLVDYLCIKGVVAGNDVENGPWV